MIEHMIKVGLETLCPGIKGTKQKKASAWWLVELRSNGVSINRAKQEQDKKAKLQLL